MVGTLSNLEHVLFNVEDGIAHLQFNRPQSLNAFSLKMVEEIVATCQAVNQDPAISVLIISGAGDRAFSVGLDLKERAGMAPPPPMDARAKRLTPLTGMFHRAIAAVDRPTIAAVHGYTVGGGLEAAIACDIRIAADDARFGLTEIKHGVMPGAGGTQRLPRIIGRAHALRLALTGQLIDAQEAYRIGLITDIVPKAELIDSAFALARSIREGAPLVARAIKEAMNSGMDLSIEDGIRLEVDLSTIINLSEDAAEGPRAFAEKRKPVWKGR